MTYTQAAQYARSFARGIDGEDIWHDSWLYYFKKTGKNLLDEQPSFIRQAIRWRTISAKRKDYKHLSKTSNIVYDDGEEFVRGVSDPLLELITKDFYQQLFTIIKGIKSRAVSKEEYYEIIRLLDEGYNQEEIAVELGRHRQVINRAIRKLKPLLRKQMEKFFSSPFNSNPLKLKLKVTRSYYDNHPEKYEDFEYNVDRGSDCNEFYTQLVHKSEDWGMLIVEGKKLDL